MKINSIKVYLVNMPLKSPWITAYGSDDTIGTVLVKIDSGDYYGWGESSPLKQPTYSPEYAESVFLTVTKILAPLIINRDIKSGSELQNIFSAIKGNQFAKAALDNAWWDLRAKIKGEPLWKVIGGTKNIIIGGDDFGIQDSLDILIDKVGKSLCNGYKRIKLKFAPGWDFNMLSAVRDKEKREIDLLIENNGVLHPVEFKKSATLKKSDIANFRVLEKFKVPIGHGALISLSPENIMISENCTAIPAPFL